MRTRMEREHDDVIKLISYKDLDRIIEALRLNVLKLQVCSNMLRAKHPKLQW